MVGMSKNSSLNSAPRRLNGSVGVRRKVGGGTSWIVEVDFTRIAHTKPSITFYPSFSFQHPSPPYSISYGFAQRRGCGRAAPSPISFQKCKNNLVDALKRYKNQNASSPQRSPFVDRVLLCLQPVLKSNDHRLPLHLNLRLNINTNI